MAATIFATPRKRLIAAGAAATLVVAAVAVALTGGGGGATDVAAGASPTVVLRGADGAVIGTAPAPAGGAAPGAQPGPGEQSAPGAATSPGSTSAPLVNVPIAGGSPTTAKPGAKAPVAGAPTGVKATAPVVLPKLDAIVDTVTEAIGQVTGPLPVDPAKLLAAVDATVQGVLGLLPDPAQVQQVVTSCQAAASPTGVVGGVVGGIVGGILGGATPTTAAPNLSACTAAVEALLPDPATLTAAVQQAIDAFGVLGAAGLIPADATAQVDAAIATLTSLLGSAGGDPLAIVGGLTAPLTSILGAIGSPATAVPGLGELTALVPSLGSLDGLLDGLGLGGLLGTLL